MKTLLLGCVLLALVLAGCHEPADPAPSGDGSDTEDESWRLSGGFTENTTQRDVSDLENRLGPYDASLVVMESFPMQYGITGPRFGDCAEVQEMLQGLHYIASVGECQQTNS